MLRKHIDRTSYINHKQQRELLKHEYMRTYKQQNVISYAKEKNLSFLKHAVIL